MNGMKHVNIRIGPVSFDRADYDAESDVLYLHVGEPQWAEGEETPEGHVLRYAPGTQNIVGLTLLGAQRILDRDEELRVTIPGPIASERPRAGACGCLAICLWYRSKRPRRTGRISVT